jgi:hypothetical protein
LIRENFAWAHAQHLVVALQPVRHRHARLLHIARGFLDDRDSTGDGRREQRFEHGPAERGWHLLVPTEHTLRRVTRIAAEQLIATVAGEHLLDAVLLGALGADQRRHSRGVTERLFVVHRDARDAVEQVARRHVVLVVIRCEVPCRDSRVLHLVVTLGIEADRVRFRRRAPDLAQHPRDGRAVRAAR